MGSIRVIFIDGLLELILNGPDRVSLQLARVVKLLPECLIAALNATTPMLARMSGSGATCFALYENTELRDAAERAIALRQPGWWRMASVLR